jgi:DNA repair protein RadC
MVETSDLPAGEGLDGASRLLSGTRLEPIQLELPGVPQGEIQTVEWQSPVQVLTRYLDALAVSSASTIARALLGEFGSLSDLLAAPRGRLRWVAGRRVAEAIKASRDLTKARLLEEVKEGPVVSRSPELLELLQLEVGFLQHERLLALYVDQKSRLMRIERIGEGSLGEVAINARKIIGCGLAIGATGFILVHNHPSGSPAPSAADLSVTSRLRTLGKEVELHLLDHLVIARGRFGSIEDFWREARWTSGSSDPQALEYAREDSLHA